MSPSSTALPTTTLPSGEPVPILGQGTWNLGDDPAKRKSEIEALRLGLDLGMTLLDTAEMYGSGASEKLVAAAIAGRRDEAFLVSKVLPQNASAEETVLACEDSLKRLKTDRIDLYLLHWRGDVPLEDTLEGFESLRHSGKIRHWGVSNFDVDDMEELVALAGGDAVATNQVLYNLTRRGIEWDLLPWCRKRPHPIPIMAYSPIEQGRLLKHSAIQTVAARHNATPTQIALAWVLKTAGTIVIPRTGKAAHVRDNRAALEISLTQQDLQDLDTAFPAPKRKRSLEML